MDDLVKLLHECDGQLGLAVHRGEGDTDRWKSEADGLIGRIRRMVPIVEDLLHEVQDLRNEIYDGYRYMSAFANQSDDPGTGTLAWLHRNRDLGRGADQHE